LKKYFDQVTDQDTCGHQALFLIGVSGVGKSTVADEIGRILTATGAATAIVDTDMLAQYGPPPKSGDLQRSGFYDHLKCVNLAAVWANFKAAGARFIVVSAGIDSAALRLQYSYSLAGCSVQVVRLIAARDTVRRRLCLRDDGAKLDRALATLAEQEAILDAACIEDFTVVNEQPAATIAAQIVARTGWNNLS
jgi:hypothetical protein